ncbi:PFGI-1 class ICE element type IV pilus protein PilL2 [Photobacterium damselae]|uniref:PFGI-1 class ICE element type IV pilus protein PilL2 n=1 Tax=Photobacterium damselae TaxID=38293 RepID=UPI0040678BED
MKSNTSKLFVAIALLATSQASLANTQNNPNHLREYVTNGLTIVNVDANIQQKDPLQTVATIHFPQQISTVGQALNYLLMRTGYTLAEKTKMGSHSLRLLQFPLPLVQRSLELVTVNNAIQTLIGQGYTYKVDHINRTILITCPADQPKKVVKQQSVMKMLGLGSN